MAIDTEETVTASPDDFMQHAIELIYTPADDADQYQRLTARASLCVSLAKELRLGRSKSRKYNGVDRPARQPELPPAPLVVQLGELNEPRVGGGVTGTSEAAMAAYDSATRLDDIGHHEGPAPE